MGCASTTCLTNTPTLYFGNTAVAANYCTDTANNIGKLVTLKWQQNVHTLSIPFFPNWTVSPTVSGSFRCE
jgi:hypothetical protein